jgi:hypothetical protein
MASAPIPACERPRDLTSTCGKSTRTYAVNEEGVMMATSYGLERLMSISRRSLILASPVP